MQGNNDDAQQFRRVRGREPTSKEVAASDQMFALHIEDHRRVAKEFGLAVERERSRRGWTAEEAARRARMAPKTWQRLEDGEPVRNLTYNKLDSVFGLKRGTSLWHWQQADGNLQKAIDDANNRNPMPPGLETKFTSAPDDESASAATLSGRGTVSDTGRPGLAERIRGLDLAHLRRLRDMVDAAIVVQEEANVSGQGAIQYSAVANIIRRLNSVVDAVDDDSDAQDDIGKARAALASITKRHPEWRELGESIAKSDADVDDLSEYLMSILKERMADDGEH